MRTIIPFFNSNVNGTKAIGTSGKAAKQMKEENDETTLTSTLSGVNIGDKVAVRQVLTFTNNGNNRVESAVKVLTVK